VKFAARTMGGDLDEIHNKEHWVNLCELYLQNDR